MHILKNLLCSQLPKTYYSKECQRHLLILNLYRLTTEKSCVLERLACLINVIENKSKRTINTKTNVNNRDQQNKSTMKEESGWKKKKIS